RGDERQRGREQSPCHASKRKPRPPGAHNKPSAPDRHSDYAQRGKQKRAWFRNDCHTKSVDGPLAPRTVVEVPVRGCQASRKIVPGPPPQATIRTELRFVPLPNIAPHVVRAVRTGRGGVRSDIGQIILTAAEIS